MDNAFDYQILLLFVIVLNGIRFEITIIVLEMDLFG